MSVRNDSVIQAEPRGVGSNDLRLLVGFSEGSASNIVARMIAPKLGEFLNVPTSVERIPGENGALSLEHLARAGPDGRTLGIAIQTQLIGSLLYSNKRYDPIADFTPVALLSRWPMVLAVSSTLGVQSVAEFIALAKSRPGALTYGVSAFGGSPHLAAMLFAGMTSIEMQLRVYSETNTLYEDLAAGRVTVTFNNTMSVLPLARAGRLRMLASTGPVRTPAAPELPTLREGAVPGYEIVNWVGILAPAGTPESVVARTHAAIVQTLETAEIRKLFEEHGMEPVAGSPARFAAHLRNEIERWSRFVEANRGAFPNLQ